jgi:DNA-binding phage protein
VSTTGPEAASRPAPAAAAGRRLPWALAAVAALALAAVLVAALVVLPGSTEPPATGAAGVVPGDALAYVHFSTDRTRPAVQDALRLGARFPTFPLLSGLVTSRLTALLAGAGASSSSLAYRADVRPWLGQEAALAFLNTATSTAGSELVLDVRRPAAARRFLARARARSAGAYRGTALYRLGSGTEVAYVRHYLVLGAAATVRGALDASAGRVRSLAATSAYQRAAAGEPAGRVLDAYFSGPGIIRLLAPQGGVIGALGALLYAPGELGTTMSVSPSSAGASVYVHTALGRSAAGAGRAFTPSLASELPSRSLLLLDVTGLARVAPRVLNAGATAGIAGRVGPLLARLGGALRAEGVNTHGIESLFAGETAVALVPGGGATPALVVVGRAPDQGKARRELADLEAPLAALFPAPKQGPGQVPQFSTQRIAGVAAHQLALAPGFVLDYAVFRHLLVVSTSLQGIGAVAHHGGSLAADPTYARTLAGQPRPVTSLVFADFNQLLRLAERTGLARGATYQALRPDLYQIRAVGLQTTRGQHDSTAQITLEVP